MKTADAWTNLLDFALFERMTRGGVDPLLWSATVKLIKDVQLDAYRAGMEAAARMCPRDNVYMSAIGKAIADAAKTAQLP